MDSAPKKPMPFTARLAQAWRRLPRRFVLPLIMGALIVVFAGGAYLAHRRNENWRVEMEDTGAALLGVPVTIGDVIVHRAAHFIILENIVIGNPPGYGGGSALQIATLRIDGDFSNRPPLLTQIAANGVQVELVIAPGGINLLNLLANMAHTVAMSAQAAAKDGPAAQTIQVGAIEMRGNVLDITGPQLQLHPIAMPGLQGANNVHVTQMAAAPALQAFLQMPLAESFIFAARRGLFDTAPAEMIAAIQHYTGVDVTRIGVARHKKTMGSARVKPSPP